MKDSSLFRHALWVIDGLYVLVLVLLNMPALAYVQFCLAFFLTLFSLVLAVICRSQQSERLPQGISLIMLLVTCLYALNPQGPLSTFVYFVIGG